ncbi:hypothetical protein [Burkholderia sp. Ed8]|uniref:hypothetical protein n=1 Tax=Burkholderia sp. Ed8 TaxID=3112957 RepID=UPI00345C6799
MQVRVKLSSDPLINVLALSRAIARAVSPAGEEGLKGIDCIVGKRMKLSGVDGTMPSDLTSSERRTLQKLLPKLRKLRCPISDKVAEEFFESYRKLPGRPKWEPELVHARNIGFLKAKQDAVMCDHQLALWEAFREGQFMLVDANHVEAKRPDASDFISRDDAIAYLTRCGFLLAPRETQDTVGEKKVTDPEAVYKFCLKMYRAKQKNYNMLTADEFGISGRQVRNIIREIDEARGEPSPFPKQTRRQ